MKSEHESLLSKRNAELEKQLAQKNRDLEIEAALERVRTVAMEMRVADNLLNICQVLFEEFKALGFADLRNAMINILHDEKGYFLDYDFNDSGASVTPFLYDSHPMMERQVEQTRSASDAFIEHILTGDELEEFKVFREKNGEAPDPKLENISALYYYFYSIGVGSLGISTFSALTSEKLDVIKRFRNVFDLAYRRYADIQLAEAQAKEAQIQLALERVRARTMAMQRSEELAEAVFILFQQFKELGENPDQATIGIVNEDEGVIEYWVTMHGSQINKVFKFSIDEPNVTHRIYEGWKAEQKSLVIDLTGQELYDFTTYRASKGGAGFNPDEKRRVINVAFFSKGLINVQSTEARSEESVRLLERFAGVFEGTYTRFLDLQKAEAQAREAQIELALERVRARTMAMQHSSELKDAASILFQQVELLGINTWTSGFQLWEEDRKAVIVWTCTAGVVQQAFRLPVSEEDFLMQHVIQAEKNGEALYVEKISGKALENHYNYMATLPGLADNFKSLSDAGVALPLSQVNHAAYFTYGYLLFITYEPIPEAHDIFKRFAKVFDQTYTRFLDLQKAEEQVREAQIEAALERVRSRTMGMQKSEELHEVIQLVFDQLQQLNFNIDVANFALNYKETDDFDLLLAVPRGKYPMKIHVPYFKHPVFDRFNKAKKKGDLLIDKLTKDQKDSFFEHFFKYVPGVPEETKASIFGRPGFVRSSVLMRITALTIHNYDGIPYSEAENNTLLRFGQVFEQTYTRFLDLQKAEAQVKEAQIEAALEKVRSRSLAMHQTDELREVVSVVFEKLHDLEIVMEGEAASIVIFTEGTKDLILWNAIPGQSYSMSFHIPYHDTVVISSLLEARGMDFYSRAYTFEEKDSHWKWALEHSDYKYLPEDRKQFILASAHFACSVSFTKNSAILVSSYVGKLLSEKESEILKRFARVFEQAYVRFLDLHKAEVQAREAQIELSLERVRAKTMAMHTSDHVGETVATMFDELVKLGIERTVRCGILIIDETKHMEVWTAAYNINGKVDMLIGRIDMMVHPLISNIHEAWKNKEQVKTYELIGQDLKAYYQAVNDSPEYPVQFDLASLPAKQTNNAFFFPEGAIFAFTLEPLSAHEVKLFKRFAGVFGLTYRRFLDLQRAESQAREAKIEAALEKVRSRTLAMQRSDELAETAAVLFRQMMNLGIEPNRLYIGIIRDETTEIEFWITDEDGSKVSNMFAGDADKNRSMKKMRDAWLTDKKSIVIDMHGDELNEYFHYLGDILHVPFKGGLEQKRRVQYISYFSNGFIGMASPDDQSQETIDLLDRFAYVFNLTYARFNDLKVAEKHAIQAEQDLIEIKAARKRAEDALEELRATQTRLIQSEKMASLGELTAGIAHEIQNPLNFVNNFSEVNQEMIEELEEELKAGNVDEALALAADIKGNEQKINHHGKRADGIVKGMLAHSRSGGGEKEPTNINALADEFMRLAYHGLRAKDKAFNAELVTNFDENLPKVNVIPQDMGRAMLNLFNNAFYAVNQKMKASIPGYKPEVSVTTGVENGRVLIKVKDNGIGMPDHIKEKIMQPFFTTKPTGEGTGLGLSLTYDMVVKGHGGKINIGSKEGDGAEFIIDLPIA